MNRKIQNILLTILVVECCVSFSYYGVSNLIILYLVKNIGLSDKMAYATWKMLGSLTAFSALISSLIGEWVLSYLIMSVIGVGLMAVGYGFITVTATGDMDVLNFGLACVACGMGMFGTNARNLMGMFSHDRHGRYNSFTLYHFCNLIGQITGPIVLSYIILLSSIGLAPLAAICLFFAVIYFIYAIDIKSAYDQISFKQVCFGIGLLILLMIIMITSMQHQWQSYIYLAWFIALSGVIYSYFSLKDKMQRYQFLHAIVLLMPILMIEVMFKISMGPVTVFIDRYVNHTLLGFNVPTGLIIAMEPLMALALSPLFFMLWRQLKKHQYLIDEGYSFCIGLLLLCLSYLLLSRSSAHLPNDHLVQLFWIIGSYSFMALAELFTVPIAVATMIGYSPGKIRGLMMGMLYLSMSLSSLISGSLGEWISPKTGNNLNINQYTNLFGSVSMVALCSAILLLFVWRACFYSNVSNRGLFNLSPSHP